MVDERNNDEYEHQEESEYHFSDDQLDYDFESDMEQQPIESTTKPAQSGLMSKLTQYRKVLIGSAVFVVLVFVVYQVLVPNGPEVNEITPPKPISPIPAPPKMVVPAMPQQPAVESQQQTTPQTSVLPAQQPTGERTVLERLAALEEENRKIASLLQTQYAQKMDEYEAENNAAKDRVQELNKRLANMEATINQMAKLLEAGGRRAMTEKPAVKSAEPKLMYTVQAIIPGRAWLKSDMGETVTVAEGEMLKNAGRVVKIDPYDGVVEIDRGGRIVTLSYGVTGD